MNIFDIAQHGVGAADAGLAILRVGTGAFFAFSGMNKLFNKERHAQLLETMRKDKIPLPKAMGWWVPACEFMCGSAIALGVLTSAAASVLAVLMAVAIKCEGRQRVTAYSPINAFDRADDWLYLPECIYFGVLVALVLCGGGKYSMELF